MPRTRSPYPPEFRDQLVALHWAGRTIEELARLRKAVRQLRVERDILGNAAA